MNKILRMYYETVGKEIEEMKNAFVSGDLKNTNSSTLIETQNGLFGQN